MNSTRFSRNRLRSPTYLDARPIRHDAKHLAFEKQSQNLTGKYRKTKRKRAFGILLLSGVDLARVPLTYK